MQILDFSGSSEIMGLLFTIMSVLVIILGLYIYFFKDKDIKILLIALAFLFFALSGLEAYSPGLFENNLINPWRVTMNFLGALVAFFAVEPWKVVQGKK